MAWRNIEIDQLIIAEVLARGRQVPDEHDPPNAPLGEPRRSNKPGSEARRLTSRSRETRGSSQPLIPGEVDPVYSRDDARARAARLAGGRAGNRFGRVVPSSEPLGLALFVK
jgi:hypothetical protein